MRMDGKIIVEKDAHGKDRYVVDCKRMKFEIPDQSQIKLEMIDKKCSVYLDKDRLASIEIGRQKIVFKSERIKSTTPGKGKAGDQANPRPQQNDGRQPIREAPRNDDRQHSCGSIPRIDRNAFAPYNFIPLNETIVSSEYKELEQLPSFAVYSGLSGYIDLDIVAMTPIYVGGSEENHSAEKKVGSFFGPGGITKIPGSSLRGMVRNLVEIVSYSKMGAIDSKRNLYYRGLADTSSLGEEYKINLVTRDPMTGRPAPKSCAGYLREEGRKYYITPAKLENGKQYTSVKKDSNEEFVIRKRDDGKYLVISGKMQGKRRDWLINAPDEDREKRIEIPAEDIYSYKYDVSRMVDKKEKDEKKRKDGDILRILEYGTDDKQVPCFYVQWKDSENKDRVSFGHTGYFRLAYKQSIGEHLDSKHKNSELMDMATAIFGISEKKQFGERAGNTTVAGRVYFDDAVLVDRLEAVEMKPMSPQILSAPKPTTFQHYLTQPPNAASNPSQLNHWNSPAGKLRGNKLYWHRKISSQDEYVENSLTNWREKEPLHKSTQHIVIKPLKEKSGFRGRIRYENLSKIELGALLFVLALPTDHFHKLGMGKSLGMGSVKIVPQLFTCDRQSRYRSLFKDGEFHTAFEKKEIAGFMKDFEQYILSILPNEEQGVKQENEVSLWQTTRLKELKIMLNWNNTELPDWQVRTRYMSVQRNEYRIRRILSAPSEVIKPR